MRFYNGLKRFSSPCLQYLLESLHQSGILAVGPEHAPPAKHYHGIKSRHAPDGDVLKWLATFSDHAHLTLDCLFLRLLPTQVKTHASVFWAVVDAIRPSQALSTLVQKGVQEVSTHSNRSSFTFLHLRIENNWLEHCQRRSRLLVGSTVPCKAGTYQHDVVITAKACL